MNIVFIGPYLHPKWFEAPQSMTRGFVESILQYANASKENIQLYLITNYNPRQVGDASDEFNSFSKYFHEMIILSHPSSYMGVRFYNRLFPLRVIPQLKRFSKEKTIFHAISTNPFFFGAIIKLLRFTGVHHVFSIPNDVNQLKRFIMNFTYNHLWSSIITSSLSIRSHLSQFSKNTALYQLYPPIDTSRFRPRNGFGEHESKESIVSLGSLERKRFPVKIVFKSLKILIEDYKRNVFLQVIARTWPGNQNLKDEATRIFKKMGLDQHVDIKVRNLNEQEKIRLFNKTSVYLQPFKRQLAADPPIAMLEAMSCGIPVVSTAVGEVPYIIQDDVNGKIINNPTPESLASALNQALEKRHLLSRRARETIQSKMSYPVMGPKILFVYKTILAKHQLT